MAADPTPTAHAVAVREMTEVDLRFASALHRSSLGHGLFPSLGPRFLRCYLRTFTSSPTAVALVAELDGAVAGFLVGVLDEPTHYRGVVRQHGLRLAAMGLTALAVRPRVALRFARTRMRRYVGGLGRLARADRSVGARVSAARPADAILTHVAVAAEARSARVGSALVVRFTELARGRGAAAARLVTRSGEAGAGPFYERLGWRRGGEFVDRDGLTWLRYRLDLQ